MSEVTKDLIDFLIKEVESKKPDYTEDQCLLLASEIIFTNFPKCLSKLIKGEEWRL